MTPPATAASPEGPTWRERLAQILDVPTVFHLFRFLLVGGQARTKQLVHQHLAVSADDRVLDVCCGIGEFARVVPGMYCGVDATPRFVAGARRRWRGAPGKQFQLGDALELPFGTGTFDKAMIINSLHHFSDEQARRVLAEVRRVTRGRVVVVDADGTPSGLLRRALVALDRGRFMRSPDALVRLVRGVVTVEEIVTFDVGLYTEVLLRCGPADPAPRGRRP